MLLEIDKINDMNDKKNQIVLTGIVFREDNEYAAICPDVNVATQGKSVKRLRRCYWRQ